MTKRDLPEQAGTGKQKPNTVTDVNEPSNVRPADDPVPDEPPEAQDADAESTSDAS